MAVKFAPVMLYWAYHLLVYTAMDFLWLSKVLLEHAGLKMDEEVAELQEKLGNVILTPTKIM